MADQPNTVTTAQEITQAMHAAAERAAATLATRLFGVRSPAEAELEVVTALIAAGIPAASARLIASRVFRPMAPEEANGTLPVRVFSILSRAPAPMSTREISDRLGRRTNAVSTCIVRLHEQGLVARVDAGRGRGKRAFWRAAA